MDDPLLEQLLRRMDQSRVASAGDLVGCTPAELDALESRYGVRLPQTYRRYLEVMGHGSGRLFTCDHMAASYRYVLEMTDEERQSWVDCHADDGSGPPPGFDLPADGLLIAGRLGEQYEFIMCGGRDDSPVWYFNRNDWQVWESHPSVLAWLECWCEEAEWPSPAAISPSTLTAPRL